jgi:hypothetical protein
MSGITVGRCRFKNNLSLVITLGNSALLESKILTATAFLAAHGEPATHLFTLPLASLHHVHSGKAMHTSSSGIVIDLMKATRTPF